MKINGEWLKGWAKKPSANLRKSARILAIFVKICVNLQTRNKRLLSDIFPGRQRLKNMIGSDISPYNFVLGGYAVIHPFARPISTNITVKSKIEET
jgi:hypothetical protein